MKKNLAILALATAVFAFACTKKEQAPTTSAAPGAASTTTTSSSGTTIEIASVGETMAFDKTTIEAKAGTQVTLKLKNNATSPAMKHNWVLLKSGTSPDSVGVAAIQAGEAAGYIPAGNTDILAHTPLSEPGKTVEVTFTVPPAGEYPYLCTYPGHYALMKGVLKSVP
jgi:azurin